MGTPDIIGQKPRRYRALPGNTGALKLMLPALYVFQGRAAPLYFPGVLTRRPTGPSPENEQIERRITDKPVSPVNAPGTLAGSE
jgi:hypothetical protein